MKFLYSDEPIIACSTGYQKNASMAVLRISGFKDLLVFQDFFSANLTNLEPRRVYYTSLLSAGVKMDDICLTYFKGPSSYNGENILELSVHGNTLNIERILNLFTNSGLCRNASPGEFTYRALKNKKLTLSQVEGLDLLLNANSTYALDQGLSFLSGDLQQVYQELLDLFIKHKAALELSIDFLEDIGEEGAKEQFFTTLKSFSTKFNSLAKRVQPLAQNLIQPEIAIAGLPNSGKSTLFNLLLGHERAIVSPIAGTTRDYLTENISISGVVYKLVDTAGVRESSDIIEVEGIRRAQKKIAESFYSILLINPFEVHENLSQLLKQNFDLTLFTHCDLPGFLEAKSELIRLNPTLGPMGAVNLHNPSIDFEPELVNKISLKYDQLVAGKPILLTRHKDLILQGKKALDAYEMRAKHESDVAILSSELNTLGHCISELIGIVSPELVLNSIFANFCIGK
jgi:tRNA modification GTPase